jgi:hypothetical protein
MSLKRLLQRRELWSIGIYKLVSSRDILRLDVHQPRNVIGESGLRLSSRYQSTVADPFLFSYRGVLYLFHEVMTDHGHGEIWVHSMTPSGDWISHGCILREEFHLSYPQVFEHGGRVYMIPEASHSGRLFLYAAVEFPGKWECCATLLTDPLLDPTLFIHDDGTFMLFGTTRSYELRLYSSSRLEGPYNDNGLAVTSDKSIARCAGSVIELADGKYRPAQDCSRIYGERIRLLRITNASPSAYDETLAVPDLFAIRASFMSIGYHHLSTQEHAGSFYVAVDGRRKDAYANTLMLAVIAIGRWFRRARLVKRRDNTLVRSAGN